MNANKPKTGIEILLISVLTVTVYLLAAYYDILESIVDFSRQHESWQLDEIIPALIFLAFALLIFSYRQWRDILVSDKILRQQNKELQAAIAEIKQLRGILPICSSCKKIRDDQGFWHQVEVYIRAHTEAEFSHGICPDCMKKLYGDFYPG